MTWPADQTGPPGMSFTQAGLRVSSQGPLKCQSLVLARGILSCGFNCLWTPVAGVAEKNLVCPSEWYDAVYLFKKQGYETIFGPRARNFYRGEPLLIKGNCRQLLRRYKWREVGNMMVIGVGIDLPLKKLKKNHHPCVTMKRNLQTVEGSDNTKRKSFTFRFQRPDFAAVYMGNGFDRPSCGVIRSLPYPPWYFSAIWGTRRAGSSRSQWAESISTDVSSSSRSADFSQALARAIYPEAGSGVSYSKINCKSSTPPPSVIYVCT